jgi:UDP-N-acetylmuramyl pentapeptide phosphotransferase/UDP-N-acetylglucosamine-1-phosphate transferase
MGDSGALFIGYMLFVMAMLVVNNSEPVIDRLIDRTILPVAPMVIFIFPMVDTFSVYTLRLYAGGSPFAPDRYHIHHLVLAFTTSHFMTSLIINFVCLLLICLFSLLAFRMSTFNFIILFFVVFFGLVLFVYFFRTIYNKKIFSIK